jgi:hypothetical protein
MSRSMMTRTTISLMLVLALGAMTGCGGGGGAERDLIRNFFTASRVNDRATLGNIAMVSFNPQEEGTVSNVSVESVGEERRRPLRMRELAAAVQEAQQAQQEFAAEMKMYQDENLDAIARVIEAERASESVADGDQEVQEAWTKWLDGSQENSRVVSEAESALGSESAVAQLSAFNPNNPIAVQGLDGELLTKDVTISATVEKDGSSEDRTMVVTLEKVELNGPDGPIEGRWVISNISG